MEKTLEQRIEGLEKRVAELERRAPEQPKTLNLTAKLSIDDNLDVKTLIENLKKIIDQKIALQSGL